MSDRREQHKRFVDQLKEQNPCTDCGEKFPAEAMDLDHVRGLKLGNISDMLHLSWPELRAELLKTEPVCARCHRIRTRDRRLDETVDRALDADLEFDLSDGA